jgi:hypothetical protein
MTTSVKVEAHCAEDIAVYIYKNGNLEKVLHDKENYTFYVYGDDGYAIEEGEYYSYEEKPENG